MGEINIKKIMPVVILMLTSTVVGFSLGRYYGPPPNQTLKPATTQIEQPKTNSLFRSQTATFQGAVTKVSGNKLSVKDEKGQSGDFPISKKVVIYQFKEGSNQASASSDLKAIATTKQALVVLELMDGKYQVISISYLPPPPKR